MYTYLLMLPKILLTYPKTSKLREVFQQKGLLIFWTTMVELKPVHMLVKNETSETSEKTSWDERVYQFFDKVHA